MSTRIPDEQDANRSSFSKAHRWHTDGKSFATIEEADRSC